MSSVHITTWGDAGPRVVLIHGGVQGSGVGGDRLYAAQKPLASRGWQLLVPDRPGHGRTPARGAADDAETDGEWAADLLGDGAHLVGHSFGGCVAVAAASRRPEVVRSLTLIEPAMQNLAMRDPQVWRFGVRAGRAIVARDPARRLARFSDLVGIPPEIGERASPEEQARMGRALRRLKVPSKATLTRQLGELRRHATPLLVVTGGWSPAFTAIGNAVAATGGGVHRIIHSPHHFPHLISEGFNDVLHDFMTSGRSPESEVTP
ncbi:MAG: alpha/beta fold hydrolase [Acidimicrobiales bacterium]